MKACERCGERLDAAAKAAQSSVCTPCGVTSGDCDTLILLPMFKLRPGEHLDWKNLMERMH